MSKEKEIKLEGQMSYWERNRLSHGYLLRKSIRKWSLSIFRAVLLFGLCFLILQPLLNKLSVSFMEERDLYDSTIISIPRHFTTANYKLVADLIYYWKALFNTAWVSLLSSVLQIVSCTMIGYGFARYKFPFKNALFACVMLTIIIPPQTIMSSLYLHFQFFDFVDFFGIYKLLTGNSIKQVSLIGNGVAYFMLAATGMALRSGLYIFMLRQYFRGVPKELEEAAYVDGCGKIRTFIQIMIPDAKPILTSVFLFSLVWQWTDNFYGTLFFSKITLLTDNLGTIPEKLQHLNADNTPPATAYAQMMTATGMLMTIAPLLILYLFAQKGFVESLSQTGIKM